MNRTIATAITAASIAFGGAAFADAHLQEGFSMLEASIMNDIERMGIDPMVLNDLRLSEIAAIKSIIDSDENDSTKMQQVEAIIENSGS
ncbi:hypothetical protein [Jannaschia sp. LMIT008]|uniref:hypothetical protein n=1 Tax=Jannaschia maritima TaxID=3032585 RepID=UPI002810F46D|nr:hypothetical protein [Jannaschia sp. LMIT008]